MFKDVSQICATPLRLKVLTFFVRQEGEWADAGTVASTLSATRDSVQKELTALARLDILRTRKVKRVQQYTVDSKDILYPPLAAFVTSALVPSLKDMAGAFRGIRGITLVAVAGLLTGETKSPVDVLVVSRHPDTKKIERAVKKLEQLSALPLRYAVLETSVYDERRQAYDRFLRDIFDYRHTIVLDRPG